MKLNLELPNWEMYGDIEKTVVIIVTLMGL